MCIGRAIWTYVAPVGCTGEAAAQFVAEKPLEGPEERTQARKEQRPGWLRQDTPLYSIRKLSATIAS